jgi:carbon starvation protein
MFEALFILTTIDAGTRVARFLVQEYVGRMWKPMERTDWLPGSLASTAFVVFAWAYFIWTGSVSTIWPMFGTANQLLAAVALAVATAALLNAGKAKYVWVTLVPLVFVSVTTLYAGWRNIFDNFMPMAQRPGTEVLGWVNVSLTAIILMSAVVVLVETGRRAWRVLARGEYSRAGRPVEVIDGRPVEPLTFGEA